MSEPQSPPGFEQAKQLFLEGLAHFEAARFADAERCFEASLTQVPGRVSTLVNLAATRIKLAKPDAALQAADQALAGDAQAVDAWLHRGGALGLLGRRKEALESFDALLGLNADHAVAWQLHGQTLQHLDRHDEALVSYDKALALAPSLALAWSNRGGILREQQRLVEAAESFRQAIAHGADPELHGYYLASVTAQDVPATAPVKYVAPLFDDYAAQFDEHLVQGLHYRGHSGLVEQVSSLGLGRFRSAIDLGCGTGLCGPLVRPLVDRLTGVDLSPLMVEKARALGVYDQLVVADIVQHLRRSAQNHDLVLATDVFIYIGDLAPVFDAVKNRTTSGGIFGFTAECTGREDVDFELLPSLRYAQSEASLRRLADSHGFDVLAFTRQPVREDQRRPIDGFFVCLQRR